LIKEIIRVSNYKINPHKKQKTSGVFETPEVFLYAFAIM
jgi:hypothetical protein